MILLPPCLFSGEQNKQAIVCRNDVISTCKKLVSAGVTSIIQRYHELHVRMPTTGQNGWRLSGKSEPMYNNIKMLSLICFFVDHNVKSNYIYSGFTKFVFFSTIF